MVVVFPAPLGPMKPRICPRSTEIVSRSSATNLPYFFVRSRVSTTAMSFPIEGLRSACCSRRSTLRVESDSAARLGESSYSYLAAPVRPTTSIPNDSNFQGRSTGPAASFALRPVRVSPVPDRPLGRPCLAAHSDSALGAPSRDRPARPSRGLERASGP